MTKPALRLLVTGGRDYNDRDAAWSILDRLDHERGIGLLIHGACPSRTGGADRLAHDWAYLRGHVLVFPVPVDRNLDGEWPAAGIRRNARMLRISRPTAAVAFPGGRGTADMVARLREAGVPVWIPFGGVEERTPRSATPTARQGRGTACNSRTG